MIRDYTNLVIALVVMSGAVVGATSGVLAEGDERINLSHDDDYDGVSEYGEQTIEMSVTLEATEPTEELTVWILETDQAFIDGDSFEVTAADPDWDDAGDGTYEIEELDTGEEIKINFDAYPRKLNDEELPVSEVYIEAENPREYQQSDTLAADLESSPWLAYNDAEDDTPLWIALVGGGIAIAGLTVGGYSQFSKRKSVKGKAESALAHMEDMRSDLNYDEDKREATDYIKRWKEENGLDDAGLSSSSGSDFDDL